MNEKKVRMRLVGIDGNAFSILGAFKRAARKQGWDEKEIEPVLHEATSGDYNHLLATIIKHVKN